MDDVKIQESRRKNVYFFPALIIGLLVMQIGLCFIGFYMATRSDANVVEHDYYDKALHWDQQVAAEQASAALGWQADLNISAMPDMQANRTFVLNLKDRAGAPIAGAKIRMIYFHHAHARQVETVELHDQGAGFYSAVIPIARPGIWEFRMVAEHGKEKWMKKETVNLSQGS